MTDNRYMDAVEKALRAVDDLSSSTNKLVRHMNSQLTKTDKKMLEYFWNSKRNEIRKVIPETVVVFFKTSHWRNIFGKIH